MGNIWNLGNVFNMGNREECVGVGNIGNMWNMGNMNKGRAKLCLLRFSSLFFFLMARPHLSPTPDYAVETHASKASFHKRYQTF